MRTYFFYGLIVLGILSVLYFSWIESPRLSLNGTLPEVISHWTDKQENENLRTGVPFLLISIIMGALLIVKKKSIKAWVMAFICLVILVFLAELGQLFLPLRRFDWEDIAWGVLASFLGLLGFFIIKKGIGYLNGIYN
ncbi:MAG: hypothetical protein ACM31G_11585 [Flavobacteriales bacterium]